MRFRTRSILQIAIIGFLGVCMLLMVALYITARQLNDLTVQSELTVSQSTEIMRAGRQLVEHTSAMERLARQYMILGDDGLLDVYATRRREFLNSLEVLMNMSGSERFADYADRLIATEWSAYQELLSYSEGDLEQIDYPPLLETAYGLSEATGDWVNDQVGSLRARTRDTQQSLAFHIFLLVASALMTAGVCIALIMRPLSRIALVIRRLGKGDYEQNIEVVGPRDIQHVGEQLIWLRGRLQRLERQRHSFLRRVSHELKTPLAAMQESASLLSDPKVGELSVSQRELLGILEKNGNRLFSLIENLLLHHERSFAVLESAPEKVNLAELLREVMLDHEVAIRHRQITTETELANLYLVADRERLRVIMDNLISNAVKYSPRGGSITLALYRQDREITLDVQDQGPGVAASEIDAVFKPYYRGQNAYATDDKGSGLGLAITREYVELTGGHVEMVTADQGAHFRVRFPAVESQHEHESG